MPSGLSRASRKPPIARRRASALARRFEEWFSNAQRELPWRDRYVPYHVWISEVMLQQTRMEVVLPYWRRFIARFPDIPSLAAAPEHDVLALWSGLGYYRRARMLRAAAIDVCARFGGELPRRHEDLLSIDGIGRYTAGAIASIAFDQPHPVVDGNVARVLSRIEMLEEPLGSEALNRVEWAIAEELVNAARSPRALNQAMMELGARICRPRNPECHVCPMLRMCRAGRSGVATEYPRAAKKAKSESVVVPLYLVANDRGELLMRREAGKLMTGMLHFPHGNGALFGEAVRGFRATEMLGTFRHSVTNRRIEFQVCEAEAGDSVGEGPDEYLWVNPEKLDTLPHPSYVKKAVAVWKARKKG